MTKIYDRSRVRCKPQRTCVSCRMVSSKGDLVRLVRTPEGSIEVDITGRKAGRGAYICSSKACWEDAFKKGHMERALRAKLESDDREKLISYGADCLTGDK